MSIIVSFTKKTNLARIYKRFGKKKVWENWLLMISENSNFVKNGEFGKSLSKVWEKLKQDDKRRLSLIVGSYEISTFGETNEFFEKSIKGLANFKWELKKRASFANSDYRKMANLEDKGKFRKNVEYAKNSSKA